MKHVCHRISGALLVAICQQYCGEKDYLHPCHTGLICRVLLNQAELAHVYGKAPEVS